MTSIFERVRRPPFYAADGSRRFLDHFIFAIKAAARVAIMSTGVIMAPGNSGITSISPLTDGSLGCADPSGSQIFVVGS